MGYAPPVQTGPFSSGGGADGADGADGAPGADGADGADGAAGATGPAGLPIGQHLSGTWAFNTATDFSGISSNGQIWLNNATQTAATEVNILIFDAASANRTAEIEAWADSTNPDPKGYLYLADRLFPGSNGYLIVTLTGGFTSEDGGLTRRFPCTVQNPNGIPMVVEPVVVIFQQVGDAGA